MVCPPQDNTARHQMEGMISETQCCFKKAGFSGLALGTLKGKVPFKAGEDLGLSD